MTTMKRLLILALLGVGAVLVGCAASFVVIDVTNWIAPFRPRDDDTLREFIPVAIALLAGAVTATLIFVLGRRALIARWRGPASGDIRGR